MKNALALFYLLTIKIATVGVRRLAWLRRQLLTVMSRKTARWLMLAVSAIAVIAEYFPRIPLTTLIVVALLGYFVARRGSMRIGIGWLTILAYYEVYLWAIFVIVPVEAFFGDKANVGSLVASAIHCIAFTYVAWDLGASPPPPRRKRERAEAKREGLFGWLTPMPAPAPVTVPTR